MVAQLVHTMRKVLGSIRDGVIGILLWQNPSGRNMVQRSTHPLIEMSTRDILLVCICDRSLGLTHPLIEMSTRDIFLGCKCDRSLRLTHPLIEMSTRDIFLGSKCDRSLGLTTLPQILEKTTLNRVRATSVWSSSPEFGSLSEENIVRFNA